MLQDASYAEMVCDMPQREAQGPEAAALVHLVSLQSCMFCQQQICHTPSAQQLPAAVEPSVGPAQEHVCVTASKGCTIVIIYLLDLA